MNSLTKSMRGSILAAGVIIVGVMLIFGGQSLNRAVAQSSDSKAPSAPREMLSADKAVLLMLDHQTGLCSLVGNFNPDEFKNNVLALADIGKTFKIPTVLTTSFDTGPNGPIMPEIRQRFPDAPFIHRPGQINAWDNEDFVKAVKATGRKQIIIAGIVTDVCVAFPALSALGEGYSVFVVTDASGTFSPAVQAAAMMRMSEAGAIMTNWFAVACELQRDWRNHGENLATLLADHIPAYKNLIVGHESNTKK